MLWKIKVSLLVMKLALLGSDYKEDLLRKVIPLHNGTDNNQEGFK